MISHVYSFTIPSRLWYVNKSVDSLQIFNKSSACFCKCTVKYKVILGLLSPVLLLVVCIKIKVADRLWLTWRRVKEYCTGETSNLLHWYRIGGGGKYQNNNAIGFKLMSGMDYTVSGFF